MKTQPDTVYLPAKEVVISKKEKVPYPVEKELTRWQQIKLELGGWAFGIIFIITIVIIVLLIYRTKKK